MGENFVVFMAFHSIANLFLQITSLSIGDISLHKCYSKHFTVYSHFHSKCGNFPCGCFPYTVIHLNC